MTAVADLLMIAGLTALCVAGAMVHPALCWTAVGASCLAAAGAIVTRQHLANHRKGRKRDR